MSILRDDFDLFEPSGTDSKHTCRFCKYCYSSPPTMGKIAHCDICGAVSADDAACENFFEKGDNTGSYYTKEEVINMFPLVGERKGEK